MTNTLALSQTTELIRERVLDLVAYVEAGRALEAIAAFYAPNVAMQENLAPATVGRGANLEREREFFGNVTVHAHQALAVLVDGDRAAINWLLEYTDASGTRYRMDQVALQTWQDGLIVHERYVYDPTTIVASAT